jgi:hypothetical protein
MFGGHTICTSTVGQPSGRAMSLMSGMSARITVNWILVGAPTGSHDPEIGIIIPQPIEKRQLFVVATLDMYGFHDSVTELNNLELSWQQRSDQSIDSTYCMGLRWRF